MAGQKRPETSDGSEPTRAEAFVVRPDVPLTVPEPPHAAEPAPVTTITPSPVGLSDGDERLALRQRASGLLCQFGLR